MEFATFLLFFFVNDVKKTNTDTVGGIAFAHTTQTNSETKNMSCYKEVVYELNEAIARAAVATNSPRNSYGFVLNIFLQLAKMSGRAHRMGAKNQYKRAVRLWRIKTYLAPLGRGLTTLQQTLEEEENGEQVEREKKVLKHKTAFNAVVGLRCLPADVKGAVFSFLF